MTTYGKLNTRAAREHMVQTHPTHLRHVAENAARRAEQFILVPQVRTDDKKDFSAVQKYLREYARHHSGGLCPVTSEQYLAHLEKQAQPAAYRAAKMRNGKRGTSRRMCQTPLLRMDETYSPAANEYFFEGAKHNPRAVAEMVVRHAQEQIPFVEAATGCRVEGFAVHVDSGIIHISWALSRVVDGELHAANGLGLLGPWSVAVDRQRRSGVFWAAHDAKFVANLKKLKARGRTGLPCDIALARKLDELCTRDLPGLDHFTRAYAQSLTARRTNAVETQKARLRDALASLEEAERQTSFPEQEQQAKGITR